MGGTWFRDYRALRDFRAFETVTFYRYAMSLSAYTLLVRIGIGLAVAGGIPLFGWILTLLRDMVLRDDLGMVWQVWSLIVLYGSAVLIAKELLTHRRMEIAANPHLRLFRDLDIPLSQVLLQYSLRTVLWQGGVLCGATILFLVIFGAQDPARLAASAWMLPVLLCAVAATCYCAVRNTARQVRTAALGWVHAVIVFVAGTALGVTTAAMLGNRPTPLMLRVAPETTTAVTITVVVTVSIATVCFLILALRTLRRVRYWRLLLPIPAARTLRAHRGLHDALWHDLRHTTQGSLVTSTGMFGAAITGMLVGMIPILPLDIVRSYSDTELLRGVLGVSVLGAATVGVALRRIGPTAKLFHLRYAVENGMPLAHVVRTALATYLTLTTPVGILVVFDAWLVTGHFFVAALPVALLTTGSAVIAECLAATRPSTDGTTPVDFFQAFLSYVMLAPCAVASILPPLPTTLCIAVYTLIVLFGASRCLRIRLTRLSSPFQASRPGMSANGQYSTTSPSPTPPQDSSTSSDLTAAAKPPSSNSSVDSSPHTTAP